MRMSVNTPVGKFTSVEFEDKDKQSLFDIMTQQLQYVNFETDHGTIIIKGETLKNSVIIFEDGSYACSLNK